MRTELSMIANKLLCRPRPYQNESLTSYITRLSESNYYPSTSLIFQMSGLKPRVTYVNVFTPSKDNLTQLSYLTEVKEDILWSMTFAYVFSNTVKFVNPTTNFVTIIKTSAIKNHISLCPICLQSEPYYQLIWDLLVVQTCPYHQCLLINRCPQCQQLINRSKPSIVKCKCKFDFRKIKNINLLTKEQVDLSKYIYKVCNIYISDESNDFLLNHPVWSLDLSNFLQILYGILHFCGINYIYQKILDLVKANIYPVNNSSSIDIAFYLLINWDCEFPRLMSDYINYLNSCYS